MELREKCLPSSVEPGTTVPFWARHTWPWANSSRSCVSSTGRGHPALLCAGLALPPQLPRESQGCQGCSPIPTPVLWHVPEESLVGGSGAGKGWGHVEPLPATACSPKAFPARWSLCSHSWLHSGIAFPPGCAGSCPGAASGTRAALPGNPGVKRIPAPSPPSLEWLYSPHGCKCR